MCSLWSNQWAQYGAINVLTMGQSMGSVWSNQCVHCVGQTNCTVWSNQCAHCVAINMHPDLFSIHTTVRQPNQSISNQLDLVLCMQQTEISCALSTILCGVLTRVQQCRVLWRWDKDVYMLFSGCVAAYLRGMGTFNCGSSVRLHYWEKVSYYEWQDQVS
jgi:hypothetical protein